MAGGHLQAQFADLAHQGETAELGMWAFIATEVLFLGGLFAAYCFYSMLHPLGVVEAARHTKIVIGSVNTLVLLTSSFVMSWAALAGKGGDSRFSGRLMTVVAALGMIFLALKGVEYAQELDEGLWPGAGFALQTAEPGVGEVFYFLYWLMTGIHALHLLVGIGAIAVVARRAIRGDYSRTYQTPVRVVSLYWHFVDIVWIFLFVLIYLPGRGQ